MRFPDFFVVGAPKSGTTTIYHWLKNHASVFVPVEKEPRFFCDFESTFTGPGGEAFNQSLLNQEKDYLRLFEDARAEEICGDFSVDYLAYDCAAENIHKAAPNAKVIMILRNPVERAFSEHLHLVRDLCENKTFKESLVLEEERLCSGWQPLFAHKKRGLYSAAVDRYFKLFGHDNVKIFLFEDLTKDPKGMMEEICSFLGIEKIKFDYSLKTNVSGKPRLMFFQKIMHSDVIKKLLLPVIGRGIGSSVKWWLISRNTKKSLTIDVESERMLVDYFAKDIQKLSGLIDRDLSSWA